MKSSKILSLISVLALSYVSKAEYSCTDVCNLIHMSDDAESAALNACAVHRMEIPRPLVYELCIGVFLSTYKSVCLNSCDASNPIVDHNCQSIVRASSVTPKTGVKACLNGHNGAVSWMQNTFNSFTSDAGINLDNIQVQAEAGIGEFETDKVIEFVEEVIEEVIEVVSQEPEPDQPVQEEEKEQEPVHEETESKESEKGFFMMVDIDGTERELKVSAGESAESAVFTFCSTYTPDTVEDCSASLLPLVKEEMSG